MELCLNKEQTQELETKGFIIVDDYIIVEDEEGDTYLGTLYKGCHIIHFNQEGTEDD